MSSRTLARLDADAFSQITMRSGLTALPALDGVHDLQIYYWYMRLKHYAEAAVVNLLRRGTPGRRLQLRVSWTVFKNHEGEIAILSKFTTASSTSRRGRGAALSSALTPRRT